MIWQDWNAFFAMGGYGLYVWGSFIVILACMLGEQMLLALRWKSVRANLKHWVRSARRSGNENQA